MPWWAISYLIILLVIILISIIKDVIDHKDVHYIFAEFTSGAIETGLVIACWYTGLAYFLSWLIIPLLLYSIIWDQYALAQMKAEKHNDLTDTENEDMHHYSKLFAFLLVLPAYAAGIYLSYTLIYN